jgi:hypothetical protein
MMYLGRRFAPGDRMLRFVRTVGRTLRLNVARRLENLRATPAASSSWLANALRELGPYAAIALVVPGGSLIALTAWAFRHRGLVAAHLRRAWVVLAAFGAALILPGKL